MERGNYPAPRSAGARTSYANRGYGPWGMRQWIRRLSTSTLLVRVCPASLRHRSNARPVRARCGWSPVRVPPYLGAVGKCATDVGPVCGLPRRTAISSVCSAGAPTRTCESSLSLVTLEESRDLARFAVPRGSPRLWEPDQSRGSRASAAVNAIDSARLGMTEGA
jgi:hypothetical protein